MQTSQSPLELSGYSVAFGDRTVLAEIDLSLQDRSVSLLLGPSGSGKSTLLRTLAGLNDVHPALTTWGSAWLLGTPLSAIPPRTAGTPRPGIGYVRQHAQFYLSTIRENLVAELPNRGQLELATQTEVISSYLCSNGMAGLIPHLNEPVARLSTPDQRKLAIIRAVMSDPAVLFADETTTGLDDEKALEVLELLRKQAQDRAVVVILHNQKLARRVGDTAILLSGGRVREIAPCEQFFSRPESASARSFVSTGSCSDPSPSAGPEDVDPDTVPIPVRVEPPVLSAQANAPRGFYWLLPDQLGGVPRPGIGQRSFEDDLAGLASLKLTLLVTLEEEATVSGEALAALGIESQHYPIDDMEAPTCLSAYAFCAELEQRIAGGAVVAVHCRGGLGRTGTMLAAQLIYRGSPAFEAIERARSINPRWIQSSNQIEFLSEFESYVKAVEGES